MSAKITKKELKTIHDMFHEGKTADEISLALNRHPTLIKQEIEKLPKKENNLNESLLKLLTETLGVKDAKKVLSKEGKKKKSDKLKKGKYDEKEVKKIISMYNMGKDKSEIATELNRAQSSITTKINKLKEKGTIK